MQLLADGVSLTPLSNGGLAVYSACPLSYYSSRVLRPLLVLNI